MTRTERVVVWLYDRRWLVAVACVAITLAFGFFAARVGVENRLEVWFLDDDPALASYRRFQQAFGGEETLIVGLQRQGGILDAEGQALLVRASRALAEDPEVKEVRSVATWPAVRVGPGGVEVAPLIPDGLSKEQGEAVRARILSDPMLVKRLVSKEGDAALVLVRLRDLPDLDARRPEILRRLEERLRALNAPYHLAGNGVIYAALNKASTVDSGALLAGAYAVIAILLGLTFRRVAPTVVTLALVLLAVVWTVGLMGLFGRNLNVVTLTVPTLVLIIGVSDCIHTLQHVASDPPSATRRERVARGVGAVIWPCLFNTLTSIVAFLSLLTSPMPVVRDLGVFCAAGLGFAFVLAIAGCVFFLAYPAAEPRPPRGKLFERFAVALASFGERWPRAVLAGSVVVAVVFGALASRLTPDTDTMGYFPRQHLVRQDSDWIEQHVGPYLPLEFLVRTNGDWRDPALLGAIWQWQRSVEASGVAGSSSSVADAIASGAQLWGGPAKVPADAERVASLASALERLVPADLHGLVSGSIVRVTFSIPVQKASGVKRTIERISALAQLPGGATVEPSGYLPLYVKMMDYMVDSQLSSFAVAFLLVFGLIGLFLRSFRMALLAIPANVLPVIFVLGVMKLCSIPLDAATLTIAALVLGLVVDDTVHLLYRLHFEEREEPQGAVLRTFAEVGPSMLATAAVLALGFLVLGFAEVTSVSYFGLLLALAMGSAALADLVITPALAKVFGTRARVSARAPADESARRGVG